MTAGAHRFQRSGKGERAGSDQRAVLAEAVPDHHVGLDAVGRQQRRQRQVGGQHRWLRDLGVAQVFLCRGDRDLVTGVDEDVLAERLAQQRRHHVIRGHEPLGDDGFRRAQVAQHVDVLRALAGVHEGHGCGRPAAAEHTAAAQQRPHRRRRERRQRPAGLVGKFGRIAEVDRESFGSCQCLGTRWLGRRSGARSGGRLHRTQLLDQFSDSGRAQHERTAQRRLRNALTRLPAIRLCNRRCRRGRCGCRGRCGRRGRRRQVGAHRHHLRRIEAQPPRHVLLEHDVEVGATEAERADTRRAHPAGRHRPLAQLGVDPERRRLPVDVGVRLDEVQAGRQHLVVQRHRGLEDARRAGGRLQVADVRLGRAERHRAGAQAGAGEHLAEAAHLHHVTHSGAGAVRLHQPAHRGRQAGSRPSAGNGQPLTNRVRCGDALPPAVAGAGDAAQHRVDAVAGTLGVGEPLEQEERGTFTHHEPVCTRVERARASGGQRTDLAELDEAGRSHVAIDATGDDGVELVLDEAFDGRVDGGHRGSARGIDDEVGPVEVEQVGDSAGHHVAQLAGHRVLGDLRVVHAHPDAQLLGDRDAHLGRQLLERGGAVQLARDLGHGDAQGGEVVVLAGHRVAQDHCRALVVDGLAMVGQHGTGAGDGPLLTIVDRVAHLRRDGQLPLHRVPVPVAHPAADLGVGLVGRRVVLVEVQRWVPATGGDLTDRVATGGDVAPERCRIGRVGQDCRYAHDCHWLHQGCPFDPAGNGGPAVCFDVQPRP